MKEWIGYCPKEHGFIAENDDCYEVLWWIGNARCCDGYRVMHRDNYQTMLANAEVRRKLKERKINPFGSGSEF